MCQRLKDEVRGVCKMYPCVHNLVQQYMVDLRQDMNTQTRKPKTESPETVRTEVASQLVARHSTTPAGKQYSNIRMC